MLERTAASGTVSEVLFESRTFLALRGDGSALAGFMPQGWTAWPFPDGPSATANMLVIFADRLLGLDPDQQPLSGLATTQLALVAIRAQHSDGRAGLLIVIGLSASLAAVPGPYGVFLLADARISRVLRSNSQTVRRADEDWHFLASGGERLALEISFKRGVPILQNQVNKVYSAKYPSFSRTYKTEFGSDLLKSVPLGVDASSFLRFEFSGPVMERLLAKAEMISVTSWPWMERQIELP